MFRLPVLLLALTLSAPALWSAFISGSMSTETALIRFLIAMPIAAAMAMVFRSIVRLYERDSVAARRKELARTLAAKDADFSPDRQS
ncbi:MAG: hypothetical protein JWO63_2010 [Frankiales bacterium]|nr:hypothetical protein [Frankiales bacterium]